MSFYRLLKSGWLSHFSWPLNPHYYLFYFLRHCENSSFCALCIVFVHHLPDKGERVSRWPLPILSFSPPWWWQRNNTPHTHTQINQLGEENNKRLTLTATCGCFALSAYTREWEGSETTCRNIQLSTLRVWILTSRCFWNVMASDTYLPGQSSQSSVQVPQLVLCSSRSLETHPSLSSRWSYSHFCHMCSHHPATAAWQTAAVPRMPGPGLVASWFQSA